MTFSQAFNKKIYKIRLPYFEEGSYVDPRVTEQIGTTLWTPIINPANPIRNRYGQIRFSKVMVNDEDEWKKAVSK